MQEEMGIGIVGEDQTQITPFQRQVYEAQRAKEAEEKRKQQEKARSGGNGAGGRQPNQMNNSDLSRSETVRYVSDGERDDETLEVID